MDEYFLKTIPGDITAVEFRFPPSAINETKIRTELDKLMNGL
jgi:hypothetical protein